MHTSSARASSKEAKTTLSPEEIRHLTFNRRGRGYASDDVDRVLAEVADSFETVWHDRTRLYEEVVKLRETLRANEAAAAALRAELEQVKAEHEQVLAGLERYRSAQTPSEELPPHQDRLLDELRGGRAADAEQRQQLLEFLLDALREIGPSPNGSAAFQEAADPAANQARLRSPGEGISVVPPSP